MILDDIARQLFIPKVLLKKLDENTMGEEARIRDAFSAQSAVRRHLEAQYGADKIKNVKFTRVWYSTGARMDVWEVEGDITVKKGLIGKEVRHFKFQIDPITGNIVGFEG